MLTFFKVCHFFIILLCIRQAFSNVRYSLIEKINETNNLLHQLIKEQRHLKNFELIHDEHLNCLKNCKPISSKKTSCTDVKKPYIGAFVFKIPKSDLAPFYAYCERQEDPGWTVIQRRQDGSVNFNRGWQDYKHGFGDVYGEYWIGLERLHALTKENKYELQIYLEDFRYTRKYAKYSNFKIGSEKEGYKLTIGGFSGNAGDSLKQHNNLKFTTYDKINNADGFNCAQRFKGGWWFKDCYNSHLNGRYFSLSDKTQFTGIKWNSWTKDESLGIASMLIRPL